jgi:hypothetical protein
MARTNTEIVSRLPTYKAKRSQSHKGWVIVTCPYEDCGHDFVVQWIRWTKRLQRRGTVITGRSCPYCFRAAHLPSKQQIEG